MLQLSVSKGFISALLFIGYTVSILFTPSIVVNTVKYYENCYYGTINKFPYILTVNESDKKIKIQFKKNNTDFEFNFEKDMTTELSERDKAYVDMILDSIIDFNNKNSSLISDKVKSLINQFKDKINKKNNIFK